MAKIEQIKQRILQLDAGSFQNLCDAYLSKTGYPNIVSLGSEAGTRKTTKGTPDTYFATNDGKYVFVEYSTQQRNIFEKMKNDISKCLDTSKTGIQHEKIIEIVYCHTSSNITPDQDQKLRSMCGDVGVKLNALGIDMLAANLFLYHHALVSDFLNISISTNQIQLLDDFVRDYNAHIMAAPLNTQFMFRVNEIESIEQAFQKTDVVILRGPAGTGKTRLALEYAKNFALNTENKTYCIHSNALDIYDDLLQCIDSPGGYFLIVDDANQLSGLEHIIRYTLKKSEGYNVKILITVRDYAVDKVQKNIQDITSYIDLKVGIFSDDEVKTLLKTTLNIHNSDYLEQIVRIAEGNARIAILSGKISVESNSLDSIFDVSQLYENYYDKYLRENLINADEQLLLTVGVLAFMEAIHLDNIDTIIQVLKPKAINREEFIENIYKLHESEIADICNDKAVQISDQCLSNYLLKYVFYDKKIIRLSTMIKICFPRYKGKVVTSINTLLRIFRTDDLVKFIINEIQSLWDELSEENAPCFPEFVSMFYRFNPTKTLLMLDQRIEHMESVCVDTKDINFTIGKNNSIVSDEIIRILGGFADTDDLPTALDLFFVYYLKRPDLFMQFYHASNNFYNIQKDSEQYGYFTQKTFLHKIKEHSDEWEKDSLVLLFFEIAESFLNLSFSPTESGSRNTLIFYQIPLVLSDDVIEYRTLIWQYLDELSADCRYNKCVSKLLANYGGRVEDVSIPVAEIDLSHIISLINSYMPASDLKNCLIADKVFETFSRINVTCDFAFEKYFDNEAFRIFKLLGNQDKELTDYQKQKQEKVNKIETYVSNCSLGGLKFIIDVGHDISCFDANSYWEVGDGLRIALETISKIEKYSIEAIEYYLQKNTPFNVNPCKIVNNLFISLPDSEVFQLINRYQYDQKDTWLYAYYSEIPNNYITDRHTKNLYLWLESPDDRNINMASYREVVFLEKYVFLDQDIFFNGCNLILAKMETSTFMVKMYFELMFLDNNSATNNIIEKFKNHLDLLENIYIALLKCSANHDYNGRILYKIYLSSPAILDKYINYMTQSKTSSLNDSFKRVIPFFAHKGYISIFNKIVDQLSDNCNSPSVWMPSIFESLLLSRHDAPEIAKKQDEWIRDYIAKNAKDTRKMRWFFNGISKLSIDRKVEYIQFYLQFNEKFEDFEKIPLIPMNSSWTGSEIPLYKARVDFLLQLLPSFIGLKWIRHKAYIEENIAILTKQKALTEIDELLRG